MVLAVAPGFLLFAAGAVLGVSHAVKGGSNRSSSRAMALGIGLIPLGAALWLVVATTQPAWVKLVSVVPLILVSAWFCGKALRPPESIDVR
jgi:hypothetical protein